MSHVSRRTLLNRIGLATIGATTSPAQTSELPTGVKAVWDLESAHRESSIKCERICINGLWRWQPAINESAVPETGWGHLRVPESWPAAAQRRAGSQVFFPNPAWDANALRDVNSAWQQRTVTIPNDWIGRKITISAAYLNSYAVVYIDGRNAGEMRYPAGEVDITSHCTPGRTHLLSMLVVALPLKGVMQSYSDTASARTVEGRVARKGICGDVYLNGVPPRDRIVDMKVETSVRRWEITFDTALEALQENTRYRLQARLQDGSRLLRDFRSELFQSSDLREGRFRFTASWRPQKLWDTHTPANQFEVTVMLFDGRGLMTDSTLPIRCGFREFRIDGRDFYLNGTRIHLCGTPLDNAQGSFAAAGYEATRATLQHFKSFGVNFVYTHNYGCEPGSHLSFEEILRAADDEGVLVAFSQPHFGHYDWTAPDADQTNGYSRHAPFYVRVAQNHPSVIFYSTSHNGTGYAEDMNPDKIDGLYEPTESWSVRGRQRALRAEAIIRKSDSSRIVYHHSSGNLSSMHTVNFYGNWIPMQEMSDWFEHWATAGVKPLFPCEYSVPFLWDWAMYRGWYKGKREFGSAVAPWEFHVAEWDAMFLGDRAYRVTEEEKVNLRWEADQFRKGRAWQRWDYPHNLGTQVFPDRFRIMAQQVTENYRAFRTWGVSATAPPWDIGNYWKRTTAPDTPRLDIDWDALQRPGPRPAYRNEDEARSQLAYRAADYQPTEVARALYRNNMPLLGYIGGKPGAFTEREHIFHPGDVVLKQLILINDSRVATTAHCNWSLQVPIGIYGQEAVDIAAGDQKRIPLRFQLPPDLAPGAYQLLASARFSNGESQEDSFHINVIPPVAPRQSQSRIALFDPNGQTARLLSGLGISFTRVEAATNIEPYQTLIIGKGALTASSEAPAITRVRDGLKVIVFEQTAGVLEQRFGFRIAEYGLRWVFPRIAGHPLLAGLGEQHLKDWRGDATLLPPRLHYQLAQQFNLVPSVKWAGITVPRVWRAGNRGNVSSVQIEKPACGDFLPIVDGGYDLQYSPLLEYREGKGMVLFCQLDVCGRTANDPAAETLAANILRYADSWTPSPKRTVIYSGDSAGRTHLQACGVSLAPDGTPPGPEQIHVIATGAGQPPSQAARILAIGLDQYQANSALPIQLSMSTQEHIATHFDPFGPGSPFTGISPGELHNRDPRRLPLVTQGLNIVGNGVLAASDSGRIVLSQLTPWQFDYSAGCMNIKRTFRRVSRMTTRLLCNLGAETHTPLLDRFARPVAANESRWLTGLYLDAPEEWDDPYRFFRW